MMVKGTDGVLHSTVVCYFWNKKGHYVGQCPSKRTSPAASDSRDTRTETNLTQAEDNNNEQELEADSLGKVEEISFMQIATEPKERVEGIFCIIATESKKHVEGVSCMQYSLAQSKA